MGPNELSYVHGLTGVWLEDWSSNVSVRRVEISAGLEEFGMARDPAAGARPGRRPTLSAALQLWLATRDHMLPSFAHANFARLWRANAGATTAHFVQSVAQGWLIVQLTDSAFALGLLAFFQSIPMLLLSPVGGLLADRLSRPRLLMFAQTVNGTAALVVGLLVATGAIAVWHLVITSTLFGAMFAISVPARYALVAESVPRDLVRNAVALNATTMNFSRVIGPAIAGIIVGVAGIAAAYFTQLAGYVWAVLNISRIDADTTRPRAQGSPLAILREGFIYVAHNGPVRSLMALTLAPALFSMPISLLMPAFVKQDLRGGPEDLGLLLSALGVGAVLGSLAVVAVPSPRRPGQAAVAAVLVNSSLFIVLAFTRELSVAAVVIAFAGVFQAIHMALSQTIVHLLVPANMRGRVMSIWMINWGLMPLGLLPLSAVAENMGTPVAMVLGGSLSLAVGVFVLLWGRQLWKLTRDGLDASHAEPVDDPEGQVGDAPLTSEQLDHSSIRQS